jgi:hypothetical protein
LVDQGAKALPGTKKADMDGAGGDTEHGGECVASDIFEVVELQKKAFRSRERDQSRFDKLAS